MVSDLDETKRHQHIINAILSNMEEMLDISVCNVKMCGLYTSNEPNEGQKLEGNASNLCVMSCYQLYLCPLKQRRYYVS